VLTTTEARGGITPNIVRYMLIVSLLLAVAAMVWVYAASPVTTKGSATSAEVAPR
jgi:hypothetical protein